MLNADKAMRHGFNGCEMMTFYVILMVNNFFNNKALA